MKRCAWSSDSAEMLVYHDKEWGVPKQKVSELFECLTLEIFQAGLSWSTVLRKREAFRDDFYDFDVEKIIQFNDEDLERLMNDEAIIRNRAKIIATIQNAKACMNNDLVQLTWKPFDFMQMDGLNDNNKNDIKEFIKPYVKLFKDAGFKRVGPTTLYSYFQSVGVINDHEIDCFRHKELNDSFKAWFKERILEWILTAL